jgi:ribosome-associated protein
MRAPRTLVQYCSGQLRWGVPGDRRGASATADRTTSAKGGGDEVPGPLRVRGSLVIPEVELSWRFSHSSGPGGQGVNTADSRVELRYDVAASRVLSPTLRARALERLAGRLVDGVLTVKASEYRSQLRNREAAERRLAAELAAAIAPPPRARRPTRATRASVERRLTAKRMRADVKKLRRSDGDA